ncbi:thioredoxin family protein [Kaistia algarum]|uniref:thioredoxin family protein n=1 Tax=Kaistia algarum TaxID=2083279 RepID=UPI0014025D73|nr:thioredoxin family protein [Kaistia algarum]MCX5512663.1 thioredoxin family protein [Kaistia algarum]
MLSRRALMGSVALVAFGIAIPPASAFEFVAYDAAAVDKAIRSGKPVVVHVYAPWCLQCHAQASILSRLASDPRYDGIKFFKVDYDKQKDIVKALGVPRSTLIAWKGGKQVAKMSWGTSEASVLEVLSAVS